MVVAVRLLISSSNWSFSIAVLSRTTLDNVTSSANSSDWYRYAAVGDQNINTHVWRQKQTTGEYKKYVVDTNTSRRMRK